jgi:integrase
VPEIDRLLRANGSTASSTLAMRRARVLAVLRFRERHRRTRGAVSVTDLAGVLRVFDACESDAQRRVVALLAFAGIRPDTSDGEISRLDWSAVGKTEIYVSPEVAKTKTDRHVPITPALRSWLAGHPAEGPVCPPNWQRAWKAIRKASGISQHRDLLRHTFASHFLAAYGDHACKMAMGHQAGSDVLFRHYRRAVTAAAGKSYFKKPKNRTRQGAS